MVPRPELPPRAKLPEERPIAAEPAARPMPAERPRDAAPPPEDSDGMPRPDAGALEAPEPYAAGARIRPAGALWTRGTLPGEPYDRTSDERAEPPPCAPRVVGVVRIAVRGSADERPAGARVAVRGAEK